MAENWFPKIFTRGIEQKRPKNIGKYDMIKCCKPIVRIGPDQTIYCDKPMELHRVIDTGLSFKHGDVSCNAY